MKLEQENVRLPNSAKGRSLAFASVLSDWSLDIGEIEVLRVQLTAARKREVELERRLERSKQLQKIKTEICELQLGEEPSSRASTSLQSPGALAQLHGIRDNAKGGASPGLIVRSLV